MIRVNVEKHEDGTYWGVTQNVPGVVSAFGDTLEELKKNLETAFADYVETAKELGEEWVTYGKNFVWGGNWRRFKDYNHFQVNALPMERITSLQRVILNA